MTGDQSPLFAEYLRLTNDAKWYDVLKAGALTVTAQDALIVVDMQNDFVPADELNPAGGAFAVAEGNHTSKLIVQLMEHFAACGATVVATRDYHPVDHCSFIPHGGPFPPHCIQGHVGSHFYKPIGECITKLRSLGRSAEVVFKGFHEDIDSFGCFEYPDVPESFARVSHRKHGPSGLHGCSLPMWTGCVRLKCSNCEEDVNAPPDILSCHRRKSLPQLLQERNVKRVFSCGLALDFCVLDTALNSVGQGFPESYIILDAARAAHLPGVGQHGSGFLQDPAELRDKMVAAGVKIIASSSCLPKLEIHSPLAFQEVGNDIFPEQLGPFALIKSPRLKLMLDLAEPSYSALAPAAEISDLRLHNIEPTGLMGPFAPITLDKKTRAALSIPDSAKKVAWGYPVASGEFDAKARGYFSITTPAAAFFVFGGFIYVDAAMEVVAVMALAMGSGLHFGNAKTWQAKFSASLQKRWLPVTVPLLQKKGAKLFAWINPDEVLTAEDGETWKVAKHGAFAYLFHDNPLDEDERDVFFPVIDKHGNGIARANLGRFTQQEMKVEPNPEPSPSARLGSAPEPEPQPDCSPQAREEKPAKCCVIS